MKRSFRLAPLATAFCLLQATAVWADDTEIFFNIPKSDIKPNILFFLDNSGSMGTKVTTQSVYDHSKEYDGDAEDTYIYFRTSTSSKDFYRIAKTSNKCQDIEDRLADSGVLTNYRMARLNNKQTKWIDLSENDVSTITECENDRGVHGETAGSSAKYAKNNKNAHWGAKNEEIDWDDIDLRHFYTANYVNWYENERGSVTKTRMEIVKEVATEMANELTNVNIGLMAFKPNDYNEGGRVLNPVKDIDTNKDDFKDAVSKLYDSTNTPLAEALFGAYRYYSGGAPFLDNSPVASTVSGGKYISPIVSCESNNVILLTDGEPTQDTNHNSTIGKTVGTCSGNCLDEIAKYMYENDIHSLSGDQKVRTYTVGFHTNQALLSDAANKGGGKYYLADDTDSLKSAFTEIVREVMSTNATFVSPGIAVNTFNRLAHLDTLYFSVFQPKLTPVWQGNLKRYRLDKSGKIMDNSAVPIDAVDPDTGFFKDSAKSWWLSGTQADGPNVGKGGAANRHPANNADRKVFTYYEGSTSKILSNSANAVKTSNTKLTKAMFGDPNMDDTYFTQLINWTRGADVFNENGLGTDKSRYFIGDPLHSVPQLVIYGGSASTPDVTVFFGDNQGMLHAINGSTGDTYFSFIPEEALAIQATLMEGVDSATGRPYGLDGSPSTWIHDKNKDGIINPSDGDHVYLYIGMRRGGQNYYALDVTDRSNPKFLWSIKGGTGDFTELGQTWSKPAKTKVMLNGKEYDALVFAGGYDTIQDTALERTEDGEGRAIYIVDATTGDLLWWAGPTGSGASIAMADMKYSIPAAPKIIDISGDGFLNQIYVGDMGGQVWRFDFDVEAKKASDMATGGVIARLSGTTAESNRRFYHTPDIFGLKVGSSRYLGLLIGSGWQAHPLDTVVEDRIYMIKMKDVVSAPYVLDGNGNEVVTYTAINESKLFDTTANLIGQGTAEQQVEALEELTKAQGWYIRLTNAGEKVLASSTTINNQTFITTYEPKPDSTGCNPSAGKPRLYHIYTQDGKPVINYDGIGTDEELTVTDRVVDLNTPGLPPTPQRMRIDGKDIICVGAECMPVSSVTGVVETYWEEL